MSNWSKEAYAQYLEAQRVRARNQREEADIEGESNSSRKSPKSECGVGSKSLGKNENEESHPKRVKILYHVFRSRLCDPDNIFLKYHTDALRYEKLIKDDRYQDIEIETEQFKSKDERLEITIIYP